MQKKIQKITHVKTYTVNVKLFRQLSEIPGFELMSAELDRLYGFHFGLFDEIFDVLLCHTMMLIVE